MKTSFISRLRGGVAVVEAEADIRKPAEMVFTQLAKRVVWPVG